MNNVERLQAMANELAARQKELARQLEDNKKQLLEIAEGVQICVKAQQTAAAECRRERSPNRRATEANQAVWTAYVVDLCANAGLVSSNTAQTVQSAHERRVGQITESSPRSQTPPWATNARASSAAYMNCRPAGMSDSEDDDYETWLSLSERNSRHEQLPDDDELIEAWCRKHNWPTN
jgi:hypothetical protein